MIKLRYTGEARQQLRDIKEHIAKGSKKSASNHLVQIKSKIELIGKFPFIGKVNATMNVETIRDYIVLGYKVIYKINKNSISVLAIYKYIDFDETLLDIQKINKKSKS